MRHLAALRSALLSALCLPVCAAAYATTIDDFTLVGNGTTFTFTNPSVLSALDHPHIVTFYSNGGTWYPFNTFGLSVQYGGLDLFGASAISFITPPPGALPGYDYVQFGLGSYTLFTNTGTPYRLTITPDTPSATPEPGSLLLLSTGALLAAFKHRARLLAR